MFSRGPRRGSFGPPVSVQPPISNSRTLYNVCTSARVRMGYKKECLQRTLNQTKFETYWSIGFEVFEFAEGYRFPAEQQYNRKQILRD